MYKSHFPIFNTHPNLIYLDASATALKPQIVIEAVTKYDSEYSSNIHRSLYPLAQTASNHFDQARAQVANFINAAPSEIIWTKSTTDSLNLLSYVLQGLVTQGDEIILSQVEHHANLLPWQRLAKDKQAILKFIPLNLSSLQLDFETIAQFITPRTKIVSLTHASNVTGAISPIASLVNQIKSINPNTLIIVDGAQAVSHFQVDVKDLGCDFYAFSGHKLIGPTGIGVLWGKLDLLNSLPPYQVGGNMITHVDFNQAQFMQSPNRFEAGTPPIAQAIGLGVACQFLTDLNKQSVFEYLETLTSYALEQLQKVPQLRIIGPQDSINRIGVISFTLPNIHPHDIAQFLGDRNICIRAGHHCAMPLHTLLQIPATARISLQIYNTKEDIDQTISVLLEMIDLFNK